MWFPWLAFFAGGFFFFHACLVTLMDYGNASFYLSSLLVIIVVIVFFANQVSSFLPAMASGISLYALLLAFYLFFKLGKALKRKLVQTHLRPGLSAIETNIARIAPEVEGGGA